ncbi:hypothetical protein BHS09_07390 [Myxococcus xanthus]|uniref:Uncharacterized protein n=1 Tax=Myxococcus xanthus TaxID=34 RepID=A0AAE6KR75_MYXXA|nr:hypothetical protein BHS09_07390 [Myxococcus xanthus]QDE74122.1 hypothetical protein BHS08_07395 [Myxococcus xanthus]QDF03022.1 hypothetical protein BHS04_07295 [Myxococcus xanthus]
MDLSRVGSIKERGILVIDAAADLLSLLELTDTVVTGDANLLTGALADGIVKAGGCAMPCPSRATGGPRTPRCARGCASWVAKTCWMRRGQSPCAIRARTVGRKQAMSEKSNDAVGHLT